MYVVLSKDKKILSSETVVNHDSKYHSAFLISTIEKVLNKNNVKPENLSLIGINTGPGSFTGIRACTTVARVMAQQLNIKAAGVSSLEILAKINTTNKQAYTCCARCKKKYGLFAVKRRNQRRCSP